ncbi:hypothetical protein ACG965_34530 [Streptomyces sp. WAC01325]|uniref:hypothetical protein n=1 Tax=Streptomyces sp. WAC01325 TaxID=3373094 RepID=UPI003F350B59
MPIEEPPGLEGGHNLFGEGGNLGVGAGDGVSPDDDRDDDGHDDGHTPEPDQHRCGRLRVAVRKVDEQGHDQDENEDQKHGDEQDERGHDDVLLHVRKGRSG